MTAVKMLEEKFLAHIHQLQNKQFTVKIEELIHDLALIAQEGQEVIASGNLTISEFSYVDGYEIFINETNLAEHLKEYIGKKVKIILEV